MSIERGSCYVRDNHGTPCGAGLPCKIHPSPMDAHHARHGKAIKRIARRVAEVQAHAASESEIKSIFSQVFPSLSPLDLGDDCAEILRTCWDARRNHSQQFTEADVVRLCAAFRSIGKGEGK